MHGGTKRSEISLFFYGFELDMKGKERISIWWCNKKMFTIKFEGFGYFTAPSFRRARVSQYYFTKMVSTPLYGAISCEKMRTMSFF